MRNLLLFWPILAYGIAPWTVCAQSPITGRADPRLASFDQLMTRSVAKHHLPGAALAVARNGRLVYARGFGFADRDEKQPVQPESLFRIASISKPLTAAAVLQLVERGRLKLDEPVFELLHLQRPEDTRFDARWKKGNRSQVEVAKSQLDR